MIDYIGHLAIDCHIAERKADTARRELSAATIAAEFHGDQKYGEHPYLYHLASVRNVIREFDLIGDIAVAAWLHDILEDTTATKVDVQEMFGDVVSSLVWAVTGEGSNRKQRNQSDYDKIQAYPLAAPLKLADRVANVRESLGNNNTHHLAMYREEYPAFRMALQKHCDPFHWLALDGHMRDIYKMIPLSRR